MAIHDMTIVRMFLLADAFFFIEKKGVGNFPLPALGRWSSTALFILEKEIEGNGKWL